MRNLAFTRQCFVCRKRDNKANMARLVKIDNKIVFDKINSVFARGAYICCSEECLNKLEAKNLLNKAFKCSLDNENKQNIIKELKEFGRKQSK